MTERPSILMIGNFLSKSPGTRGVCEDLAEHLRGAGWEVLTTSDRVGRLSRLRDMLFTALKERNRYRVATIDTYSGNAFFLAEALAILLRLLKKPFILILHGGNLPEFARRHPGRVIRLLSSASAVTAPSPYLQEKMKPYCPDIHLIANPIDISAYPFRLRDAPGPTILWLRAFHKIYNPALAIRAAALLSPKYPDLHLTMVGPDKGDGSLQAAQKLAVELGGGGSVDFIGGVPHSDVPNWLDKNDIFINTTDIDNTPVSLLEAMAAGCCIVTTDVGGIPYMLEDEKDALLVPPDDPEAMAEAVVRILSEPGLSRKLSQNSHLKAEQYNWSSALNLWEEIIIKAVG